MTFPFFGRVRQGAAPAGDRLGRLRKVLSKAGVSYSKENPEHSLAQISPQEPPLSISPMREQRLEFPIAATERIGVLAAGFSTPKNGQSFQPFEVAALRRYMPQGLVVPREDAIRIASHEGQALEHAIVVLTSFESARLSDRDREHLWRAFEVPVFEYLQSWDGTVIARECEVHDGLHIVEDAAIAHLAGDELLITQLNRVNPPIVRARTGLTGELLTEHCECGLETPRLRELACLEEAFRSGETLADRDRDRSTYGSGALAVR